MVVGRPFWPPFLIRHRKSPPYSTPLSCDGLVRFAKATTFKLRKTRRRVADFPITPIVFKTSQLFQAKYGKLICFSDTSFHLLELCHEALGIFALHLAANGRADLGATAGIATT
jgi:hypothetical protein